MGTVHGAVQALAPSRLSGGTRQRWAAAGSAAEEAASTSGLSAVPPSSRRPRAPLRRTLAFAGPQSQDGAQAAPSSGHRLLSVGRQTSPLAAPAALTGEAAALVVRPQEAGGASLLQLVAAWDHLAARLPPLARGGRAAEVVLGALKLAVAFAPPPAADASSTAAAAFAAAAAAGSTPEQQAAGPPVAALSQPVARGLAVAARLADLAADGLPIDAESIAAGILAEALLAGQGSQQHGHSLAAEAQAAAGAAAAAGGAECGGEGAGGPLTLAIIEERVGPIVAQLVHDVQRARQLPARVELLDDQAAAVLREVCLSFYDVRATAVEVVARLDLLSSPGSLPSYEAQVAALEALQMYAPMGHALGLSAVASQLEDRCFQILFPESYERTAAWLREQAVANADLLASCKKRLAAAVEAHPRFGQLAGGLEVHGRTKTLFSTLKKLLRLGNTAAGGRARAQLYDLMGLRAIVLPRDDLPADEAEELAAQACYIVREAACSLWECVEGRSKDYIAAPKPNGYQSLHSTMRVQSAMVSLDLEASSLGSSTLGGGSSSHATLELQIRTHAMHERAEMGEAAHAAYKGGLDAQQTLQLKALTETVLQRAATAAAAAAGGSASSGDAAAQALFRHLDQNGDGRISLEELQFALEELGVREAQAQSRAAAELLQLAAAQDGSGEDGTIGFDAFMALQRKVGLLQALSAVDHEQALLLTAEPHPAEEQQWAGSPSLVPNAAYASSSFDSELDSVIFTDVAGQPFSPRSRGSFPAAAAACRAGGGSGAMGGGLRWRQQQGWLGSGRWGRFAARGGVAAHAFIDTSNAYSSGSSGSSIDSLDSEGPSAAGSSNGAMAAKRADPSARNSVVALHGGAHATLNGSSNGTANGSSNGTAFNGSSSSSSSSSAINGSSSPSSSVPADTDVQPAEPLLQGKPQRAALTASEQRQQPEGADAAAASGQAVAGWRPPPAIQGIVRLVTLPGPVTADATWQLVPVPSNRVGLLNAAGQALPAQATEAAGQRVQALPMPAQGPCVVGGAFDRDCDFIVDAPTVSGRHVRLEVVRRRDARGGFSSLVLTDLGSTNGTWVNRGRIEGHRQVTLRPGDVVCLAEPDISFQVAVAAPQPPAAAAATSNGTAASAAAVADAPAPQCAAAADQQAAATLPAVVSALRLAGALEAAAAEQGLFPPGGAVYADLPERVRQLMAAGSHDQAYVLLLGGVMQQPWAAGMWAQLANAERHRARLGCRPGSYGAARAFYAAAADAFAALTPAAAGGALRAATERAEGLSRVYSSWAQLELSLGHAAAARTLFRQGIAAARQHPAGAAAAGAPRQLVRWAGLEWKAGEAAAAQRLCVEALELEPMNAHALTLLGNIEAAARQWVPARRLFKRALEAEPGHVAALQAWGRLEAAAGKLKQARRLFQDALRHEPANTHVLQALAVAEARLGDIDEARSLFRRCTEAAPSCTAAWHAWAKLEDECGRKDAARHLYHHALELEPGSVPTLSALGCLERRAGNLAAAEAHLEAALAADPQHVPSLHELALVREEQGRRGPARRLKKQASWLGIQRRSALREAAFQKLPPAAADSDGSEE